MKTIDLHNYEAFLLDYSEGNLNALEIKHLKVFILAHPELEIDLEDLDLPSVSEENCTADFKEALKRSDTEIPDELLLNYLEGNLSPEQRLAFEKKLALDKDLAKDLELYKRTILVADQKQVAAFKLRLNKTHEDLILNNRVIAYLEDQMSSPEKITFEEELTINPGLQKEFRLLSETILSADKSIVYPYKEALKKEGRIIPLFNLRIAGSIAAAILLILGFALIYNYYGSQEEIKQGLAGNDHKPSVKTPSRVPELKARSKTRPTNKNVEKIATVPVPVQNQEALQKENLVHNPEERSQSPEISEVEKREEKIVSNVIEEPKAEALILPKEPDGNDSIINRQNYLLLAEEVEQDEDLMDQRNSLKKGFWKRAVQVAKQVNKLGVKSIDGQENSENNYRLSFNSFSVEKK